MNIFWNPSHYLKSSKKMNKNIPNIFWKMRTTFVMPKQFFENANIIWIYEQFLKAQQFLQNWKYFKSMNIFSVSEQILKPDLFLKNGHEM